MSESAPISQRSIAELRQRVVWGIALAAGALAAAIVGGWLLTAALAAVGFQIAREWTSMTTGGEVPHFLVVSVVAVAAVVLAGAFDPWIAVAVMAAGAAAGGIWLSSGWVAGGAVYAAALGVGLVALRADEAYGLEAVLFVFAVVWVTDSAAFFVGRLLGGPKLWPAVSPKKTWSGAVGGAAGAVLAAAILAWIFGVPGSFVMVLLVGLLLSIAAQLGDLFESSVKRRFGTKDAGDLIPGHGGAMDRIDGLLFAAALAAMIGAARAGWPDFGEGLLVW